MAIRDLALSLLLFGGLPIAFRRPFIGALVFVWLGMMNPHRYTWGFAYDFPWSKLYAIAIMLGALASREDIAWKESLRQYWVALLIVAWAAFTTFFALEPRGAVNKYIDVIKIHAMCLVTLAMLNSRTRITALVAVMTLSIAFYGTKGGVFTIVHGGEFTVWGPLETAIRDNNHLATGLVMLLPLLYWLSTVVKPWWQKAAILGSLLLCAASVFGSHSRGAFLAVGAMALFFLLKSDRKLIAIPLIAAGIVTSAFVMPDKYWERIETIQSYREDASAMGRINVWTTAYRIANDRITGAGYDYYTPRVFARYAPIPDDVHSSHSIYFQALGEHGWIGLFLFITFWVGVWWICGRTRRSLPTGSENDSMRLLLRMIQVSLIGYAVGGAFVNIGNWDFPYYLAIVVFASRRLTASLGTAKEPATTPPPVSAGTVAFGNVRLH